MPFEIPQRVSDRATQRFVLADGGCHISTYSVGSHGYAQIGWQEPEGRMRATTVQRAVWVGIHGQIADGMTVDHTCKTKRCVRADHLRLLSNYENGRRTFGRDWPLGQCINGHPNSESVTHKGGRRRCRPCDREASLRFRLKRLAA